MTNGEAVNWIINISADIGKVEHKDLWHYEQALSEIRDMLESTQPRKGKWIMVQGSVKPYGVCSICDNQEYEPWHFCPNCGADMREGDSDEY